MISERNERLMVTYDDHVRANPDIPNVNDEKVMQARRFSYHWSMLHDRGEPIKITNDLENDTLNVIDAILRGNNPECIFTKDGEPVRISCNEYDVAAIEGIGPDEIYRRIGQVATFIRWDKRTKEYCSAHPQRNIAVNVLAGNSMDFPPIKGISPIPIIRQDGSCFCTPGYDRRTGWYYIPNGELEKYTKDFEELKYHLTDKDIAKAKEVLADLFIDFPLHSDGASWANNIAYALSFMLREAVKIDGVGVIPLAYYKASKSQSGKTLLVQLVNMIMLGYLPSLSSAPGDDAEWDKSLLTFAMAGNPSIVYDNVKRHLDSAPLEELITSRKKAGRLLGGNKLADVVFHGVIAVTGNNASMSKDLANRSYVILLNAERSDPEKRTDFIHPNILGYANDRRVDVLKALYTLALAWYDRGQPINSSVGVGRFGTWAKITMGILSTAGIEGFLSNMDEQKSEMATDEEDATTFIESWYDEFASKEQTVKSVCSWLGKEDTDISGLPSFVTRALEKGEKSVTRVLGKWLRGLKGTYFGVENYHLEEGEKDAHTKTRNWKVVKDGVRLVGGQGNPEPEPKSEPELKADIQLEAETLLAESMNVLGKYLNKETEVVMFGNESKPWTVSQTIENLVSYIQSKDEKNISYAVDLMKFYMNEWKSLSNA